MEISAEMKRPIPKKVSPVVIGIVISGLLLIGSALVAVSPLLLIRFFRSQGWGETLLSVAVLMVSSLVAISVISDAHKRAFRKRVIAISIGMICALTGFGSLYHLVYRIDQFTFVFNPQLAEGRQYLVFADRLEEIRNDNSRVFLLNVMDAYVDKIVGLKPEVEVGLTKPNWIRIDDSTQFRFGCQVTAGTSNLFFDFRYGGEEMSFSQNDVTDPVVLLIANVVNSRHDESMHRALQSLASFVAEQRSKHIVELHQIMDAQPEWDLLDFVYFSAITITTVGYGDILPVGRVARLIVTFQAVFGILYLAFAVDFLRSDTTRSP